MHSLAGMARAHEGALCVFLAGELADLTGGGRMVSNTELCGCCLVNKLDGKKSCKESQALPLQESGSETENRGVPP